MDVRNVYVAYLYKPSAVSVYEDLFPVRPSDIYAIVYDIIIFYIIYMIVYSVLNWSDACNDIIMNAIAVCVLYIILRTIRFGSSSAQRSCFSLINLCGGPQCACERALDQSLILSRAPATALFNKPVRLPVNALGYFCGLRARETRLWSTSLAIND